MSKDDNNNDNKRSNIEAVLKNFSILKEIDMVIAPLQPNDYMIKIGASVGGVDNTTAQHIYEAMISASIFDPSRDDIN